MGRSRFKFYESHFPYFITCSLLEGIPLFSDPQIARIILDSLVFIQENKEVKLYGYVLMENHMHMIIESENNSEVLKSFKTYTAKMTLESLKERNRLLYLKKLKFHKRVHKQQSTYQVWQEGGHPKQLDSIEKMSSCLEYIHNNPVKTGYIDDITHWRYSSARNYQGISGLIPITIFKR